MDREKTLALATHGELKVFGLCNHLVRLFGTSIGAIDWLVYLFHDLSVSRRHGFLPFYQYHVIPNRLIVFAEIGASSAA